MKRIYIKKIVAENLALLMQSHPDLDTQPKLAAKSRVGQTTIGRILRCEVDAGVSNLHKIAQAFKLEIADLVLIDPEKISKPTEAGTQLTEAHLFSILDDALQILSHDGLESLDSKLRKEIFSRVRD